MYFNKAGKKEERNCPPEGLGEMACLQTRVLESKQCLMIPTGPRNSCSGTTPGLKTGAEGSSLPTFGFSYLPRRS